jgi:AmmeMemoRadiSam system protein B
MQTRKPVVADQFYPGQHDSCIAQINDFLNALSFNEPLPDTIRAGIVPHAGWVFSGSLAAMLFSCIRQQHDKIHTFVIFGAAHGYFGKMPAVYDSGVWETPLGQIAVNEELAELVINSGLAAGNPQAHLSEHSIEVQVPFIQYLFPGAKILPIIVPPRENVIELGKKTGEIINQKKDIEIVCIGSTDLTHYGPRYGFTPMGVGHEALQWAHNVNDMKFIELAIKMEPQELMASAAENGNACGPGAAAAAIAAAKELGSTKGILLGHTNSNEVLLKIREQTSSDSVGYAAIIF